MAQAAGKKSVRMQKTKVLQRLLTWHPTKSKNKMKGRPLDVAIRDSTAVLKLLADENEELEVEGRDEGYCNPSEFGCPRDENKDLEVEGRDEG
jgi:hypothetical protein